jgi:hypothetical protein
MVSTIALLNAERQKNAEMRKDLELCMNGVLHKLVEQLLIKRARKANEKLVACEFAFNNYRMRTGKQITDLANENRRLKDALQEAFRYESRQYDASKKAQEKNLEKAGLKKT